MVVAARHRSAEFHGSPGGILQPVARSGVNLRKLVRDAQFALYNEPTARFFPLSTTRIRGKRTMSTTDQPHFQWSKVDDVAVVEVLSKEIIGPEASEAFGKDLGTLLHQGETRLLLNFAKTIATKACCIKFREFGNCLSSRKNGLCR